MLPSFSFPGLSLKSWLLGDLYTSQSCGITIWSPIARTVENSEKLLGASVRLALSKGVLSEPNQTISSAAFADSAGASFLPSLSSVFESDTSSWELSLFISLSDFFVQLIRNTGASKRAVANAITFFMGALYQSYLCNGSINLNAELLFYFKKC